MSKPKMTDLLKKDLPYAMAELEQAPIRHILAQLRACTKDGVIDLAKFAAMRPKYHLNGPEKL